MTDNLCGNELYYEAMIGSICCDRKNAIINFTSPPSAVLCTNWVRTSVWKKPDGGSCSSKGEAVQEIGGEAVQEIATQGGTDDRRSEQSEAQELSVGSIASKSYLRSDFLRASQVGCEVNVTKDFWASWTVYDKSLKFDIRLDNLPFKDFWVGVGFTNISAEPGDRVDIVALTRTNGSLTMKVFSPKKAKTFAMNNERAQYERPLFTSRGNTSTIRQSFSRLLAPNEPFNSDLNDCSVWMFYAEPTSLEETVQQAVTELLLCDVSAMCSNTITKAQSGDTAGNALTRQRRQVNPSNADLPSMYRPTVSINSPNFTAVLRQNEQAINIYRDEACDRPDPYWCQSYVEEYMNWQFDFNHASMQIACSQLRDSLFYADNRCCQSVRARGC
ncbi:hypothetical protein Tcan_15640 [Toxocara canis]|uniref:DOMON domain-containing protein n=1 Tax=Toxocara canis TaxID=6265 RepID=A0A0B2VIT6_TOXCA|nr:hypothetical protein Tcan_15640 [Toxocara canis]